MGLQKMILQELKPELKQDFYNGISSVLGKARQLASYNIFAGSPDFLNTDLNNSLSVTSEDVWRVYNKYIKNQKYVILSVVPKGQLELAAENSPLFMISGDNIKSFTEEEKIKIKNLPENLVKVEKIDSKFDRSKQPSNGPDPLLKESNNLGHRIIKRNQSFGN